mgnify:CR=1 FL=1
MDSELIKQCGDELFQAMISRTTLSPLTERYPDIMIEDAYHISLQMLQRRLDAGEKIIGKKIIETVETHVKNCIASILILDKQHKTLHKLVSPNLPKTFSSYIEGIAIGPKVGSCGTSSFLKKERK